jgi:hypothetical protein
MLRAPVPANGDDDDRQTPLDNQRGFVISSGVENTVPELALCGVDMSSWKRQREAWTEKGRTEEGDGRGSRR